MIIERDLKVVESAILLLAIYVTGQIIATPAKAFLEDIVVAKMLRRPNINLFEEKKPFLRSLIFPGYYQALPTQARKKVIEKAESQCIKGVGEDLFLFVRFNPSVLNDQKLMMRLNSFLNQYGFNRNISFSAFLVGVALLFKIKFSPTVDPELTKYAIIALVAAVLLFYRYLKFFRQYSDEMFNSYGGAK